MRVAAVIPALMNSTRVKNKNLLLVNGFPLIYYVVKACKESNAFDDIYINSEDDIFKGLAENLRVKFYHRKKENGGSNCQMKNNSFDCKGKRCQIHDHFLFDFMSNIECDKLVQVHTTSPLIEPETIAAFVANLKGGECDSLFSTVEHQHETFFKGKPLNFNLEAKEPTQNLDIVEIISWAISGWDVDVFKKQYDTGPTFCGKTGLFSISKIESIDVDGEDDLFLAEACLAHKKKNIGKFKYHKDIQEIIMQELISEQGEIKINIEDVKKQVGYGSCPIISNDTDHVFFIKQYKNQALRKHYHVTKDEFWIIFDGEFKYQLWFDSEDCNREPDKIIFAGKGDVINLKRGTVHIVECVSDNPGVCLAFGSQNMSHIYVD